MPEYQLAGPGAILILVVIIMIISNISRQSSDPPIPPQEFDEPSIAHEKIFHLPAGMPFSAGFKAWWRRRLLQRKAYDSEALFDFEEDGTFVVSLPLPRRVTRIDILFHCEHPLHMRDVVIETAEDHPLPEWTGKWRFTGGKWRLRLDFDGGTLLNAIRLTPTVPGLDADFRLWLNRRGNPDAAFIEAADKAEREGHLNSLVSHLEAYQKLCPGNPVPALRLAFVHRHRNEFKKAEIQALRAIAGKRPEHGVNICRELADAREWQLSDGRLATLRQDAAKWDLDGHHGLVTLHNERHFLAGPGAFVRERHVSAVLVRRRAAARKFRSVSLPMVSGWGGLLHTAARVRRIDGSVNELTHDRFTIGSADDDNPFIAVARRSTGTWILPDLEPGDVVEFTCDKVKLGQERPFTLANLGDPHCPTLHGRVTFTAPSDMDIVNAVRNSGPEFETVEDYHTGWNRIILEREKVIPRRSHSDPYQLIGLNPAVGFACRAEGWDAVGPEMLGDYYGAVDAADKIPERLAAAYAEVPTTEDKLAQAFYWIRDHIKYASVASHYEVLLSPERAEFVIESGMGDCKDVSYLLALVCRELGVPWEFVLMSTENGVIIEDLPADQFDHVILRAKIDDEWLYLDASASEAVFGSPPLTAQGLHALSGRDPFALATMPVVPADHNRIVIRQTLTDVDDGWLRGDIDIRLEGYVARYLDELWKHHSLTAVDADRAADDAVRSMLPDFCIDRVERRRDTSDCDVLHLEAAGRHARLVELDGKRIASFGFTAPGLVRDENGQSHFRERYLFPYRMSISHELLVAEGLRNELRAVSRVADLDLPMGMISEERGGSGEAVVLRRVIRLNRREIAGDDLAQLPDLFNRMGVATRVVVALDGGEGFEGGRQSIENEGLRK